MGVLTAAGWIGHNGSVPGFQSVVVHLPERQTSLVVFLNTDIEQPGSVLPSSALAKAVTSVLTPGHVYDV
jgi:D-alanyl-D-alanine carboxypeptidase